MPAIAKIEPITTARPVRGPFDYLLPERLAGVQVGSLLIVPFGRRRVLGVVVDLAGESEVDPARLVAPLEALEHGVPADLVRLAQWMADEYCSTPARALSLVLPAGAGVGARRELVAAITPAGTEALAGGVRLGTRQQAALQALRDGPLPAAAAPADHASLRRLAGRGLIELTEHEAGRRPRRVPVGAASADPPDLSAAQAEALKAVTDALERPPRALRDRAFLLHGVTGSGKTEVYLRAAHEALARDRGVIVLVPEIGLTPQTVTRFEARFGDTVAVLHSQLSDGERRDEWQRLRRGEARVCVGPRSAVFAPVEDLGLVVVDEEHDASYKHEGDPRYDARRVAARRAAISGAVLLAGTATPRPESWSGLRRLSLPERIDGRRLPPVEVVDMREAQSAVHPRTRAALAEVRRSGGKAIVLLNRRGWASFLSCRSCGHGWECPDCDVSLVFHRRAGQLVCHHCGHREPAPERCGECGSVSVVQHGSGTERLEHELVGALGGGEFPVFRLDSDAAAGKERAAEVLSAFAAAPAGVLVGTQMVAKGHDFPDVRLAVVLDADSTLRFPDFRAEERTFALIAQLAGRAGRGTDGRVLVQTLDPGAPSIQHACRHDAEGFLAGELERRRALRYPPAGDLIRIVCSAPEGVAAAGAANAIGERLDVKGALALGPAPLPRLRGRERSQILVKTTDRRAAQAAVAAAVDAAARDRAHKGVAFSVDVDPQ